MGDKYRVTYEVSEFGDQLQLLGVKPHSEDIENLWYEGQLLKSICVDENGVFELTIKTYSDYTLYFGIVGLEKIYGE